MLVTNRIWLQRKHVLTLSRYHFQSQRVAYAHWIKVQPSPKANRNLTHRRNQSRPEPTKQMPWMGRGSKRKPSEPKSASSAPEKIYEATTPQQLIAETTRLLESGRIDAAISYVKSSSIAVQDHQAWVLLVAACFRNGKFSLGRSLWADLKRRNHEPTAHAYTQYFSSLGQSRRKLDNTTIKRAEETHLEWIELRNRDEYKNDEGAGYPTNAYIAAMGKRGSVEVMLETFKNMPTGNSPASPDTRTLNSIISHLTRNRTPENAKISLDLWRDIEPFSSIVPETEEPVFVEEEKVENTSQPPEITLHPATPAAPTTTPTTTTAEPKMSKHMKYPKVKLDNMLIVNFLSSWQCKYNSPVNRQRAEYYVKQMFAASLQSRKPVVTFNSKTIHAVLQFFTVSRYEPKIILEWFEFLKKWYFPLLDNNHCAVAMRAYSALKMDAEAEELLLWQQSQEDPTFHPNSEGFEYALMACISRGNVTRAKRIFGMLVERHNNGVITTSKFEMDKSDLERERKKEQRRNLERRSIESRNGDGDDQAMENGAFRYEEILDAISEFCRVQREKQVSAKACAIYLDLIIGWGKEKDVRSALDDLESVKMLPAISMEESNDSKLSLIVSSSSSSSSAAAAATGGGPKDEQELLDAFRSEGRLLHELFWLYKYSKFVERAIGLVTFKAADDEGGEFFAKLKRWKEENERVMRKREFQILVKLNEEKEGKKGKEEEEKMGAWTRKNKKEKTKMSASKYDPGGYLREKHDRREVSKENGGTFEDRVQWGVSEGTRAPVAEEGFRIRKKKPKKYEVLIERSRERENTGRQEKKWVKLIEKINAKSVGEKKSKEEVFQGIWSGFKR